MNDTDDTEEFIENVTFDELRVGQSARLSRTLSQEDIAAFAAVSGDVNPAHVDADYARDTLFKGVVAHGMWGAALISRLLGTVLPGPGTIYLAQTLQFLKPVRIGDELRVTATVGAKETAKKHVMLNCDIKNQTGALVLTGVATVIAPSEKVRRPRAHLPAFCLAPAADPYAGLRQQVGTLAPVRCAVVHPCDIASLRGALEAARLGWITPLLVGPAARLRALAAEEGLSLDGADLVDEPHSHAAAARAAALAADGAVEMLMRGSLRSAELIDAVLAVPGLRTKRRLSHVLRLEVPTYGKALLVSDGVLHIQPTLADKVDIVHNAIAVAHALGEARPRVALLSAQETVNPQMASTIDAAALCKMADRGQIDGALLDGPLGFDSAISPAAARADGIVSPVAGQADILIAPDLESGDLLARQLRYMAGAAACGVVVGAAVPIALTDRADAAPARAASAALALALAHSYRARRP
jgi:phosphate acetyltransferase